MARMTSCQRRFCWNIKQSNTSVFLKISLKIQLKKTSRTASLNIFRSTMITPQIRKTTRCPYLWTRNICTRLTTNINKILTMLKQLKRADMTKSSKESSILQKNFSIFSERLSRNTLKTFSLPWLSWIIIWSTTQI